MKILLTGHKGYIGAVAGPSCSPPAMRLSAWTPTCLQGCDFGEPAARDRQNSQRHPRSDEEPTSRASTPSCIWPRCRMTRWATWIAGLTYDINHRASVRLAELAKEAGVRRFVFSSSCSTYGAAGDEFLDETAQLSPVTAYAESKVWSSGTWPSSRMIISVRPI